MLEVKPRIINLLENHRGFKTILLENNPRMRIDMADEILSGKLQKGSEIFGELKKLHNELDASQEITAAWGHSLDLLELQLELSREACYEAGISSISKRTYLSETILRLQGRGCHVASEISCLLNGGDGVRYMN